MQIKSLFFTFLFIFVFVFLCIESFSYAQTRPEIVRSDIVDGNTEAIQEAIDRGAIIDATARQRLWEAILMFEYDIAYILLDTLFEHRIDVLNCKASLSNPQPWAPNHESRHLTDVIDFVMVNTEGLTSSDQANLRSIKRLLFSQPYVDLSTC